MPEQIENRMVVDSGWEWKEQNMEKILSTPGYHKCGTNIFVPDSKAYDYAIEHCLFGDEEEVKEFKTMLVDWYFSGGAWRKEE